MSDAHSGQGRLLSRDGSKVILDKVDYEVWGFNPETLSAAHLRGGGSVPGMSDPGGRLLLSDDLPEPRVGEFQLEFASGIRWRCTYFGNGDLKSAAGFVVPPAST